MKIKEATELFNQDKAGQLRMPNNLISNKKKDLEDIKDLFYAIFLFAQKDSNDILREAGRGLIVDVNPADEMHAKQIIRTNPFTSSFKMGDETTPYSFETKYGTAEFVGARRFFENGEYPAGIKKGFCFKNSFLLARHLAGKVPNVKQLTGISYLGKPFLHSVVYHEQMGGGAVIIDLNHDLVMGANSYLNLTSFEVLSVNDGEQIKKDMEKLFGKTIPEFNLPDVWFALAYDDLMPKIKKAIKNGDSFINLEDGVGDEI